MYKSYLLAAAVITFAGVGVANASDMNRKVPVAAPVEYHQVNVNPFGFGVTGGVLYSTRDKAAYATVRPQISYNNAIGFVEYGVSRHDRQFVDGGVGYRFELPYNFSMTPTVKAGYHWNKGAFVSPGIEGEYNFTKNVAAVARYDYVQYRANRNDNYIGGGLNIKF